MQDSTLLLMLAAASIAAFILARRKAVSSVGGRQSIRELHSLPGYYGYYTVIWCALPAMLLLGVWLAFSDAVVMGRVTAALPAQMQALPSAELGLIINDIKNAATGRFVNPVHGDDLKEAIALYLQLRQTSQWIVSGLFMVAALLGFAFAWSRIQPAFRARNRVESVVKTSLVLAS
jgi:phosphate transport system permease protein